MMKQAQVIYYLSRGGALEHPHLIDVDYSEENGLLLQDIKRSLVAIRGKGMPDLFSWSYKTKYRNDFIWHDVSDKDVVLPMSDAEYILKGSEIVEGENALHLCPNEEIQCKKMLKDHCCLIKSPLHRTHDQCSAAAAAAAAEEECVIQTTNIIHPSTETKVHKKFVNNCSSFNDQTGNDADKEDRSMTSPFQQCRGEKPSPCVHKRELVIPSRLEKTPPRKSITAVFEEMIATKETCAAAETTPRMMKKTTSGGGGSSLIFRQMLPCADIGTKTQQNGLFHPAQKQQMLASSREINGPSSASGGFSSWRHKSSSTKIPSRKAGKLVSLSGDNETKLSDARHSHSLAFGRGGTTTTPGSLNQVLQDDERYSNLTRYRPRHSFSNSDYLSAYDLYLRAEKVKEVDNEFSWPRQSNASRVSTAESLYEVDCKAQDDSSSVGSHIISKLVLDAKANDVKNSSGNRETNNNIERIRKNKLDWEKNLQDAVNMIIRPPNC